MITFKKIIRMIFLTLIIILASTGMIGIFPNYRDRYMHNEIKTEQVGKKEEDGNSENKDLK